MDKMSTHTNHLGITNYFGYATIAVEWIGAITSLLLHPVDISEPYSQYGYYGDTRLLFGLFFTTAAILYYLFSRNLNQYWKHMSKVTLAGGVAFVITGWHTYTPYAQTYIFDLHNIAITLAIACYSFPMLFISYSSSHEGIAKASRLLFITIFAITVWSFVARVYDVDFIFTQLAILLTSHTWIAIVNYLHLQHHRRVNTL